MDKTDKDNKQGFYYTPAGFNDLEGPFSSKELALDYAEEQGFRDVVVLWKEGRYKTATKWEKIGC
jgi:hypothetical protein